jgi:asparagine synthase (glutamine-hydrolysing)
VVSGIVGIYRLDGKPARGEDLKRMNSILAHRGPDAARLWCDREIGLGHRMLCTTAESLHEELPFVKHDAELAITADARLDNQEELISLLNLTSRSAADISDSELILAAYEKWGEAVSTNSWEISPLRSGMVRIGICSVHGTISV